MKKIYQDDSDTPLAVCDFGTKPMIMKLWGKNGDVNSPVWKVGDKIFNTASEAADYWNAL
jgi:hypothetical protein